MGRLNGVALICLLLCLGRAQSLSQSRLEIVGGPTFDFGDVYSGSTVSHDVTLKNVGTDTLVITDVMGGCGCTGTLMSSDHIAPNGISTLSISFSSKEFSGAVQKVVGLNTNDTANGHVRITFTANVIKSLSIDPEYLMFRTSVDSAASAELSIVNTGSSAVRILSAEPSTERLSVIMTKDRIRPGEESVLKCTFTAAAEGVVNGTITIKTDRPKIPAINVRFFALVGGKRTRPAGSSRK